MIKIVRIALVPMAVLALAACGGGSDSSSGTAAPSATPTGAPGGGFGGVDFQAVQTCLKAAGISVPTPSGGFPTGRPSNRPSGGTRPTDMPRPSGTGGPGGGQRGGMGQVFRSKEAQTALKACGITIPTGRPTAAATAAS